MLGAQLSHEQVKHLSDKVVENVYKRYEAHVDSKTTETLIQSFVILASKAIGIVVKVDDVEALQKDQQEDFVINSTLLSTVWDMALHRGCLLVVVNAALNTAKHADLSKESERNLSLNLAKKLTKNLQKRSPYHIHGFLRQGLQKSWASCGW